MPDLFLIPSGAKDFLIPKTYTESGLSIAIAPIVPQLSWYKAGFLKILLPIGNNWLPIGNKSIVVTWEQIIEIPYKEYRLSFTPERWLNAANFTISPYQIQYNPMGLYAPLPSTIGEQPVLDSLPTTFSAPVYNVATAATAYQALAANPSRQGFAVTNNGTAPVYIDLDPPTGLTNRMFAVPVGGTYISDFVYQGAVFIWSANAAAQSCQVRELVQ
jgi:hypothetical protein